MWDLWDPWEFRDPEQLSSLVVKPNVQCLLVSNSFRSGIKLILYLYQLLCLYIRLYKLFMCDRTI